MPVSSLSIGSGNKKTTDSDIIRDSRGIPFIPGSAIAGVTRHMLKGIAPEKDEEYFGNVGITGSDYEKDSSESKIIFYDVFPIQKKEKLFISVRDQVALDDCKTAIEGAKFDMEVLEPGVSFVILIAQNVMDSDEDRLDQIATVWRLNAVRIGAKSTRGYGAFCTDRIDRVEFDFTEKKDIRNWLTFDPLVTDNVWKEWKRADPFTEQKMKQREQILECVINQAPGSGLSIRKYTTEPSPDNAAISQPDYGQLTAHVIEKNHSIEKAIIPGTSWAGAFRHHMRRMEKTAGHNAEFLNKYFGYVGANGAKLKSRIIFSESILDHTVFKILSRNAIDRFTGGASDKALYTEETCFNGDTTLKIYLKLSDDQEDSRFISLLAAAIADLHEGILSVGGETAIGRGLFQIKEINGRKVKDSQSVFTMVRDILEKGD